MWGRNAISIILYLWLNVLAPFLNSPSFTVDLWAPLHYQISICVGLLLEFLFCFPGLFVYLQTNLCYLNYFCFTIKFEISNNKPLPCSTHHYVNFTISLSNYMKNYLVFFLCLVLFWNCTESVDEFGENGHFYDIESFNSGLSVSWERHFLRPIIIFFFQY